MKTISMLEFRQNSDSVISAIKRGVSLILTFRGKKLAVIHPYEEETSSSFKLDPFFTVCEGAVECPSNDLLNEDEDSLIYGIPPLKK